MSYTSASSPESRKVTDWVVVPVRAKLPSIITSKYLSLTSLVKVTVLGLTDIPAAEPAVGLRFTTTSLAGAFSIEIRIGGELDPRGID